MYRSLPAVLGCLVLAACSGEDRGKGVNNAVNAVDNARPNNTTDPEPFSGLVSCPDLGLICGGECASVLSDDLNCGSCGLSCASGLTCEAGVCVTPCASRRIGAGQRLIAMTQEPVNAAMAADLDGDGHLEYLVLEDGEYSLSLRLGRIHVWEETPSGELELRGSFDTNSQPETVLVVDLDGDDDLDVMVLGPDPHRVSRLTTLLTDGDSFVEVVNDPGTAASYGFIVDWNRDTAPDVLIVSGEEVLAGVNVGEGLFEWEAVGALPDRSRYLEHVDVDGDGRPEIIASTTIDEEVSLTIHQADLSAAGASYELPDTRVFGGAVGDLDGDGANELVALGEERLHVLGLASDMSITERAHLVVSGDEGWAGVATAADTDGDGQAEVWTADGAVYRLEGDEMTQSPGVRGAWRGFQDVAYNETRGAFLLSSSRSAGGPGHVLEVPPAAQIALPTAGSIALADIDSDGVDDIVFAGNRFGWTSIATGENHVVDAPGFGRAVFRRLADGVIAYQRVGSPGEFELVSRRPTPDGVEVVELQRDEVSEDVGDYVFADLDRDGTDEWISRSQIIQTTNGVASVQVTLEVPAVNAATDFDGDGFVDLMGGSAVYSGASGMFEEVDSWRPRGVLTSADLNGDGKGDLYSENGVFFGGEFPRDSSLDLQQSWDVMAPYDFDADGDHEFITVDSEQITARVYSSQANGIEVTEREIIVGGRASSAVAGDVDGDGFVDLVVSTDQGIHVLRGSCED